MGIILAVDATEGERERCSDAFCSTA